MTKSKARVGEKRKMPIREARPIFEEQGDATLGRFFPSRMAVVVVVGGDGGGGWWSVKDRTGSWVVQFRS
jgi:hypothetical protein